MIEWTGALAGVLFQVAQKVAESAIVEPALEKSAIAPLREWLSRGYDNEKAKQALQKVFEEIAGKIENDKQSDPVLKLARNFSLTRLQTDTNDALRRQVAYSVLAYIHPGDKPPESLRLALQWPASEKGELGSFLFLLRESLARTDEWRPLIEYANEMAGLGIGKEILDQLKEFNSLLMATIHGQPLKEYFKNKGFDEKELEKIEWDYREQVRSQFSLHEVRGMEKVDSGFQVQLMDTYLEVHLSQVNSRADHNQHPYQVSLSDGETRLAKEKQGGQKLSDAVAKNQRLVLIGDPGSGKTISLSFIALMLAYNAAETRLCLDQPYLPLLLPLNHYAHALRSKPSLSLDNFLLEYLRDAYSLNEQSDEFLRKALESGKCLILLDGLDEIADDHRIGTKNHNKMVDAIRNFSRFRCSGERGNRLIVASRLEGYWSYPLLDFVHMEINPLLLPDEVEAFLFQWYMSYERLHHHGLAYDILKRQASNKVDKLMPRIMSMESIMRLARNPLLLTILALVNKDDDGQLPNQRIKLYDTVARTITHTWRQNMDDSDRLFEFMDEERILDTLASLAYWMHENAPEGTAGPEELKRALKTILTTAGEKEVSLLSERLLNHARFQTGLLIGRGGNQLSFFHMTFQEYLAARCMARLSEIDRRELLKHIWKDPHWQEVILLTAGYLGLINQDTDEASIFIESLLRMEADDEKYLGRAALLAGRAMADMDSKGIASQTCSSIKFALRCVSQNLDSDTLKPTTTIRIPPLTRAAAAEVFDELGHVIDDLYSFIKVEKIYIAKYPVTNGQYESFLYAEDYLDPELWAVDQEGKRAGHKSRKTAATIMPKSLEELSGFRLKDEVGRIYPKSWNDAHFGIARRAVPVTGVSWYEANAFCRWLQKHWKDSSLEYSRSNPEIDPFLIRLPTEFEWIRAAGGDSLKRCAWGALVDEEDVTLHCNTMESGIEHTTPVWMYPQGASPHRIMDLSGNVSEWLSPQQPGLDTPKRLKGGAWNSIHVSARIENHITDLATASSFAYGFRVVIVPGD